MSTPRLSLARLRFLIRERLWNRFLVLSLFMTQPNNIQYKRASTPHGAQDGSPETLRRGTIGETHRMVAAAMKRLGLHTPFKGRRMLPPKTKP